jgi:hypothetical protein
LVRIFDTTVPRGEADDEHWWIMVNHLKIAKRGEILGFTVFGDCAEETNGTRGDAGYKKTVVLADGSV